MGFKCGIVGLPNVGKSTLFNALTQTTSAEAANYPFCTIEPNVGNVIVPDERLYKLAKIAESKNIIPTQIQFVDIAGLVSGASKGEGLGNQFLSHIREVDAILHVLRCFEDKEITHINNQINPIQDKEIIDTELILSDLNSLEKQMTNLRKKIRSDDKELKFQYSTMEKIYESLSNGKKLNEISDLNENESEIIKKLFLITSKPELFVCNVSENDLIVGNKFTKEVEKKVGNSSSKIIYISTLIESEISQLDENDKIEFIKDLGLSETGLSRLIKSGYNLLELITFFTIGPKEARAWTIQNGIQALKAAGKIHSDIERGFIRAETISTDDYLNFNGETGTKDAGKLRIEGSDYIVQDGDIFNFRFNV
tara:strand:+ start:1233 stop:2333 length:1101 start_codon:yes stop_codon:yes gene_type:complete